MFTFFPPKNGNKCQKRKFSQRLTQAGVYALVWARAWPCTGRRPSHSRVSLQNCPLHCAKHRIVPLTKQAETNHAHGTVRALLPPFFQDVMSLCPFLSFPPSSLFHGSSAKTFPKRGQSGYFHNDAGKTTLPKHRGSKGIFELPFWGGVGLICLE